MKHQWPEDDEHVWSAWYPDAGLPKPTQYRTCIHPDCDAIERREAPRA